MEGERSYITESLSQYPCGDLDLSATQNHMINKWNLKYKAYYETVGKHHNILLTSLEIERISTRPQKNAMQILSMNESAATVYIWFAQQIWMLKSLYQINF